MKTNQRVLKKVMGWREWVSLPSLKVLNIKVKVDSGARTSALHAEDIEVFKKAGREWVRFTIFPLQNSRRGKVLAEAEVIAHRRIRSSSGTETRRPVIRTELKVGEDHWPIEISLVNRDIMGFRMLLGRTAVRHGFLIDPGHAFLQSKAKR